MFCDTNIWCISKCKARLDDQPRSWLYKRRPRKIHSLGLSCLILAQVSLVSLNCAFQDFPSDPVFPILKNLATLTTSIQEFTTVSSRKTKKKLYKNPAHCQHKISVLLTGDLHSFLRSCRDTLFIY